MSNVIYYFSATGNSLTVAKKIAEKLGDTKLIKIWQGQEQIDARNYERVGFVFPVYYYQMPVLVEKFIKNLKMSDFQYKFAIETYGAMRGKAVNDLNDVLKGIGYELDGEFSVWMPGNNIFEYGLLPSFYRNIVLKKSEKSINNIFSILSKKQKNALKIRPFEKFFLSFSGYRQYLIKTRQNFAQLDSVLTCKDTCTGCGICEKICPVQNIHMQNGHPVWNHRCEQCVACAQWCPQNSIQVNNKSRNQYHHPEITLKDILSNEITNIHSEQNA